MVGQTLAQKIVAKACGKDRVNAGEVEIANVDLAMIHDSGQRRRRHGHMCRCVHGW